MDKSLQNRVWIMLPKDFKKEVRKEYKIACDIYEADPHNIRAEANYKLMEKVFGGGNLTSEEKPQPKFHLGERIRIVSSGEEDFINMITEGDCYELLEHRGKYMECDLTPCTDHRNKTTEDMETKEEAKELNLCKLLQGHEGEELFSLAYGVVVLEEIRRGTQRGDSPDFLCVRATTFDSGTIIVNPNGKLRNAGVVDLVPSRALYEQYPLEPLKAWMKWKEEQTIYHIRIQFQPYDERGEMKCGNMSTLHFDDLKFRTLADRDKCISEIKAIIEKYSKE